MAFFRLVQAPAKTTPAEEVQPAFGMGPGGPAPSSARSSTGHDRAEPAFGMGPGGTALPRSAGGEGGDYYDEVDAKGRRRRKKRRGGGGGGGGMAMLDDGVALPNAPLGTPTAFTFIERLKTEGTGSLISTVTLPDPGAGTYLVLLAAAEQGNVPVDTLASITGDLAFTVVATDTADVLNLGLGRLSVAWAVLAGGSGAKSITLTYTGGPNAPAITVALYTLTSVNTVSPVAQAVTGHVDAGGAFSLTLTFAAFESADNYVAIFGMGPQFQPIETVSVDDFSLADDSGDIGLAAWYRRGSVASAVLSSDNNYGIIGIGIELRAA